MIFLGTSKRRAATSLQFVGGQHTLGFQNTTLAMQPFRFNQIEPGTLARQEAQHDPHTADLLGLHGHETQELALAQLPCYDPTRSLAYRVEQDQSTKDAQDGIITNDRFCCTRHLHLRLRASHRPRPAYNYPFQPAMQADRGGDHETCLDGAPPEGATNRRAAPLGSGLSTPTPVGQLVD
jgi:hypothetical protein